MGHGMRALRRLGGVAVVAGAALVGTTAVASAAPIEHSCGGVVLEGETQTLHDTYVIQKGDTLYQIVRDLNASHATGPIPNSEVARRVAILRKANRGVVRNRGNLIRPGQVLRLPDGFQYCTKS